MNNAVVIHGPQGCGKTRHAAALAAHFGDARVVDDWNGRDRLGPGDLALTSCERVELPHRATVMSLDVALALISAPCAA